MGRRYADGSTRFRERPRTIPPDTSDDRGYLSVLTGTLSVAEAVPLIYARETNFSRYAARYFEVATLIDAGYRAHSAPSRDNPRHALISSPGSQPGSSYWSRNPPGGTLEELCKYSG